MLYHSREAVDILFHASTSPRGDFWLSTHALYNLIDSYYPCLYTPHESESGKCIFHHHHPRACGARRGIEHSNVLYRRENDENKRACTTTCIRAREKARELTVEINAAVTVNVHLLYHVLDCKTTNWINYINNAMVILIASSVLIILLFSFEIYI